MATQEELAGQVLLTAVLFEEAATTNTVCFKVRSKYSQYSQYKYSSFFEFEEEERRSAALRAAYSTFSQLEFAVLDAIYHSTQSYYFYYPHPSLLFLVRCVIFWSCHLPKVNCWYLSVAEFFQFVPPRIILKKSLFKNKIDEGA